jgi:hypothetical protein
MRRTDHHHVNVNLEEDASFNKSSMDLNYQWKIGGSSGVSWSIAYQWKSSP